MAGGQTPQCSCRQVHRSINTPHTTHHNYPPSHRPPSHHHQATAKPPYHTPHTIIIRCQAYFVFPSRLSLSYRRFADALLPSICRQRTGWHISTCILRLLTCFYYITVASYSILIHYCGSLHNFITSLQLLTQFYYITAAPYIILLHYSGFLHDYITLPRLPT